MNELDRAWQFMDGIATRKAERIEPSPYGFATFNDRLHRVHDLNLLHIRNDERVGADGVVAECDRLFGPTFRHRKVEFRDAEAAAEVEDDLVGGGWIPERLVLMVLRRGGYREVDTTDVREVDAETLRPVWDQGIRTDPELTTDDLVVRQLLDHKDLIAAAVRTRFYAAFADGRPVSYCELYSQDGVGQVESVMTDDAYRGRGLAKAVVSRAITQSVTDGNGLTIIVADADDWPQELYRKLGYDEIGRYATFVLKLR